MEKLVMESVRNLTENIYALAWRMGLIVVDAEDPLSRVFAVLRAA